nr:ribosomal protein L2 [Ipomoea trifida]
MVMVRRDIFYIPGAIIGDSIVSGKEVSLKIGNALPLTEMPLATAIHNTEITLGKGGQLARAESAVAKLIAKEGKSATIKLPSGEVRLISKNCSATVGQVGNVGVNQKSLGRAGAKRWLVASSFPSSVTVFWSFMASNLPQPQTTQPHIHINNTIRMDTTQPHFHITNPSRMDVPQSTTHPNTHTPSSSRFGNTQDRPQHSANTVLSDTDLSDIDIGGLDLGKFGASLRAPNRRPSPVTGNRWVVTSETPDHNTTPDPQGEDVAAGTSMNRKDGQCTICPLSQHVSTNSGTHHSPISTAGEDVTMQQIDELILADPKRKRSDVFGPHLEPNANFTNLNGPANVAKLFGFGGNTLPVIFNGVSIIGVSEWRPQSIDVTSLMQDTLSSPQLGWWKIVLDSPIAFTI